MCGFTNFKICRTLTLNTSDQTMTNSSTMCRPKHCIGNLVFAEKRVSYVTINKASVTFLPLDHLENRD